MIILIVAVVLSAGILYFKSKSANAPSPQQTTQEPNPQPTSTTLQPKQVVENYLSALQSGDDVKAERYLIATKLEPLNPQIDYFGYLKQKISLAKITKSNIVFEIRDVKPLTKSETFQDSGYEILVRAKAIRSNQTETIEDFAFYVRLSNGATLINAMESITESDINKVADLATFKSALSLYFSKHGQYPAAEGKTPEERWSNISQTLIREGYFGKVFQDHRRARTGYSYDYQSSPDLKNFVVKAIFEIVDTTQMKSFLYDDGDGTIYGLDCNDPAYCIGVYSASVSTSPRIDSVNPINKLSVSTLSGTAPLNVTFSLPFSQDRNPPQIIFGDGSRGEMSCARDGCILSHTYNSIGDYVATAMRGGSAVSSITVTVR